MQPTSWLSSLLGEAGVEGLETRLTYEVVRVALVTRGSALIDVLRGATLVVMSSEEQAQVH